MKCQFGRSMIEMLGVLAVVGLLSIGGLVMYRRSMDNHKANSIFDDVNRFQFTIEERIDNLPKGDIDPKDFSPTSGFIITGYNLSADEVYTNDIGEGDDKTVYSIDVQDVPQGVCRVLTQKGGETYAMYVNNILYEGDPDICLGNNDIHFYYGNTEGLCSIPGEDDHDCGGCLCQTEAGHLCLDDVRRTAYPDVPEQEKCCPADKVNCGNHCVRPCTSVLVFDRQCQCVCPDPLKTYNVETGKCQCMKDKNGTQFLTQNDECICPTNKPYFYDKDNGGPACCGAGEIAFEGYCRRLYCDGGSKCYLDGVVCGESGCTSSTDSYGNVQVGVNCSEGNCHANECGRIPGSRLMKVKLGTGTYRYFCYVGEDEGKICLDIKGEGRPRCYAKNYNDTVGCGYADKDLNMKEGLCDPNYCKNNFSSLDSAVEYNRVHGRRRGCFFPNRNGLYCTPKSYKKVGSKDVPDKWNCYFGTTPAWPGVFCSNCDTPETCVTQCTMTCPAGQYVHTHNNAYYCCNKETNPTFCNRNGRTYDTSTWNYCGEGCNFTTGLCPNVGSCTSTCKTADVPNGCTNGFTCKYNPGAGGYTGGNHCYNETKNIWCVHYYGYTCYKAGSLCGQGCDLGGNCKIAHLPDCAKTDAATGKPHCVTVSKGTDMGTDPNNLNCLCKYGDGSDGSVTELDGHYYCCPVGHTYFNGACSANL